MTAIADIAEQVVARKNHARQLAGLGYRQHLEQDRRDHRGEKHHPAHPADKAQQIYEQHGYHRGFASGRRRKEIKMINGGKAC
jgi:hypothetical protein